MKKLICTVLAFLLLFSLAACDGIDGTAKPDSSIPVTTDAAPAPSETSAPTEPDPSRPRVAWSKAFRTKQAPEGSFGMDEVAFSVQNEDRSISVTNVSKAEIEAFTAERTRLPRSRYYEQFMDPEILPLLPVLDYALEHGYFRFCIPTQNFHGGTVTANDHCLLRTFRINNGAISALSITTVEDQGQSYDCVLVSIQGAENGVKRTYYLDGVRAAEKIVDEMPEGLSEYEKVLYLYKYLTDHVRYDYNDYYESSWCLCYDALVKGKTVCAGYAEAFYCLCNLAGIECITQAGVVPAGGVDGRHIWNVARVDGSWYLFDATWDAGCKPKDYRFFGLSDETMQSYATRYVDAYDVEIDPPCPEDLTAPTE